MTQVFDERCEQVEFEFVDKMPPLKKCANCGKDIISVWEYKGEALLLHDDKTMCVSSDAAR